jgi:hypothetical protein
VLSIGRQAPIFGFGSDAAVNAMTIDGAVVSPRSAPRCLRVGGLKWSGWGVMGKRVAACTAVIALVLLTAAGNEGRTPPGTGTKTPELACRRPPSL